RSTPRLASRWNGRRIGHGPGRPGPGGGVGRPPGALTARAPRRTPARSAACGSPPASHAASSPAVKASPAPVGSTTGTRGALARTTGVPTPPACACAPPAHTAPAGPSFTTTAPAYAVSARLRRRVARSGEGRGEHRGLVRVGEQQVHPANPVQEPGRAGVPQGPGRRRVHAGAQAPGAGGGERAPARRPRARAEQRVAGEV